MADRRPAIDTGRLMRLLNDLAEITEPDRKWGRTAFSELHKKGRSYLEGRMREAGLSLSVDAGGNLIGRREGLVPGLGALALGSHSDTVPEGGRFDGVLGVVAAIEVAHALHEAGHELRHPLEIIDFLAEEPNRYGLSCIGSRAMAGRLDSAMLEQTAPDGSRLQDGIRAMVGRPDELGLPLRRQGELAAFLELHIEQGRVLEDAGDDIGVVSDIVGIRRYAVTLEGRADHSGATPMELRQDSLAGAAEIILAIEARAAAERPAMVATIGRLSLQPNAANAVPGKVDLTLEIRASRESQLEAFSAAALEDIAAICLRRDLALRTAALGASSPVSMDAAIMQVIAAGAQALGLRTRRMPSGAGHDTAWVAALAPAGMIFITCREGRSHCPEEFAAEADIARGAGLLLETVLRLDGQSLDQGRSN